MSRHNRNRRVPTGPGAADHQRFAREFEVVARDGGTEFRIRPDSTLLAGENTTRLIARVAGVVFLMLGVVAWAVIRSGPAGEPLALAVMGLIGGPGVACLVIPAVFGPRGMYVLSVGPGGEVWHLGPVAGPGEVVAVWVECVTEYDDGDMLMRAFLYLERAGGHITELPRSRFTGIRDHGLGRALAARLAGALKVPLNDRPPPDEYSTPARTERWNRRFATNLMLVIGVAHFLGGFGALLASLASLDLWWVGLIFTCTGSGLIAGACWLAGWGRRGFALIVGGLIAVEVLVWWLAGGGR